MDARTHTIANGHNDKRSFGMDIAEANPDRSIDLAEFKLRCLEVLEQLVAPGLLITKDGRPLALITPVAPVNNELLIGSMKGQIAIHGDLFSTGIEWDAQS
jgi:antitoxin (DNA-binding transcriptional repressor) of toxin-antitoxin stability system